MAAAVPLSPLRTAPIMHLPFACEHDLCAVLAHHADGLLLAANERRRMHALKQRPVGPVIPDLIYIRLDEAIEAPLVRELTAMEASIVATLLCGRPLRAETIARRLYTRVDRLAPRLRALERWGFLASVGSRAYALRVPVEPGAVRVVAIEAKLSRWREAIDQAVVYLRFANESYVALPEAIVEDNNTLASTAAAARIGIISVGQDSASLALRAPRSVRRSADWVWLLSRTVGLPASLGLSANTSPSGTDRMRATSHAGG